MKELVFLCILLTLDERPSHSSRHQHFILQRSVVWCGSIAPCTFRGELALIYK